MFRQAQHEVLIPSLLPLILSLFPLILSLSKDED